MPGRENTCFAQEKQISYNFGLRDFSAKYLKIYSFYESFVRDFFTAVRQWLVFWRANTRGASILAMTETSSLLEFSLQNMAGSCNSTYLKLGNCAVGTAQGQVSQTQLFSFFFLETHPWLASKASAICATLCTNPIQLIR